jgi:hypothetical protein
MDSVKVELAELNGRIALLSSFLEQPLAVRNPADEQHLRLLQLQLVQMETLAGTLRCRIKLFPELSQPETPDQQ